MMARWLLVAGALLALGAGASAQPSTPQRPATSPSATSAPVTTAPTVTVTAPRLEQVPDLVEKFGVPDGKGRLARWEDPVCPVVRGLPPEMDQVIERRIRETAKAASISVAGPHCEANVAVLITRTPRAAAESLVERHRSILSGESRWPFDRLRGAAFVDTDRPVRWWYISDSIATAGGKAYTQDAPQQAAAFDTNNLFGPPVLGQVVASRLLPATEEAFSRVVVIVDANRIVGFDLEQISGYLSMVSLAQVKPDADLEHVNTIMNMFGARAAGREAPPDLTFWDRAYLGALYDTDAEINFSLQKSGMVAHIRHDVAAHDVIPLSATKPEAPAS